MHRNVMKLKSILLLLFRGTVKVEVLRAGLWKTTEPNEQNCATTLF